jgi:hypothetical protein
MRGGGRISIFVGRTPPLLAGRSRATLCHETWHPVHVGCPLRARNRRACQPHRPGAAGAAPRPPHALARGRRQHVPHLFPVGSAGQELSVHPPRHPGGRSRDRGRHIRQRVPRLLAQDGLALGGRAARAFRGADHAWLWKPKLLIPDTYESPENHCAFGRFLDKCVRCTTEVQVLAAVQRLAVVQKSFDAILRKSFDDLCVSPNEVGTCLVRGILGSGVRGRVGTSLRRVILGAAQLPRRSIRGMG